MGPALPPTPPAVIMTIDEAARLAGGKAPGETLTLGDVLDFIAATARPTALARAEGAPPPPWRMPVRIGPKTKGRRDASLRSRANRRKA